MPLEKLLSNTPIIAAITSWAIAQSIKTILSFITNKRFDIARVYGSGGMPSSHSALVTAIATSIGKIYGLDSPSFAVSIVFAMVVMYDAAGIRRAAGIQAAAINKLFSHNGVTFEEQLKELLGHTPFQVLMGAVIGFVVGVVLK